MHPPRAVRTLGWIVRDPKLYKLLISEILRAKVALFGPLAIALASKVPGLVVASDGHVTRIHGDGLATLEQVLQVFERLSGRASNISARTAVHRLGLADRHPDLELPASLRRSA